MSYRNILVEVDNSPAAKARVAAAVALARRFESALTGVFLKSETTPDYLIGDAGSLFPARNAEIAMNERAKVVAAASAVAQSIFSMAARDADLSFRWLEINGDSEEDLVSCARRHDLTILPSRTRAALGETVISAEQVAMACGGPVLVTPQAGYPVSIGKKVLVAWKDSREAARALRDAWPFLQAAEEVCLLSVSKDAEPERDELLQRHLRSHGCKTARMIVDSDGDVPAGEIIRRHVDMFGADLVVLGLYGHSRLREFVLGGVSRDLFTALPMPLLVSH